MPRGDRKGPEGQGPMTGRKLGLCTGNSNPGFMTNTVGNENGRGLRFRGRGDGFHRRGMRRGDAEN